MKGHVAQARETGFYVVYRRDAAFIEAAGCSRSPGESRMDEEIVRHPGEAANEKTQAKRSTKRGYVEERRKMCRPG